MTILVDHQLHELLNEGLIVPANHDLVNPASIDVRIGESLKMESLNGKWIDIDLKLFSEASPFFLRPDQFVLVATLETFNLPDWVAAEFRIKSSRAREGYTNALAVWCDPGWTGSKLTLELKNYRQYEPLPLYPGLRIGQMVFHRCNGTPTRNYRETGRYNGDTSVSESKG